MNTIDLTEGSFAELVHVLVEPVGGQGKEKVNGVICSALEERTWRLSMAKELTERGLRALMSLF